MSSADNNLCWVVEVCFQNFVDVVAFNASFFLLISQYLEKMFYYVVIWDVEGIGDYVVSSQYRNEVVGILVKTTVACSYEPFSSKYSY